jgi:hypothetical protein
MTRPPRRQAHATIDAKDARRLVPQSEADFMAQVILYAQVRGWKVAHFRAVRVQRRDGSVHYQTPVQADGKGFLDTECVRERLIKIETKVPPNKLTPEQESWVAAYKRAGVEVHVFYPADWPEIESVLA